MFRITRFRVIALTTIGTTTGLYQYDQRRVRAIQENWIERGRNKSQRELLSDPVAPVRHVRVYFNKRLRFGEDELWAFERYVQPIWQAAALDFTIVASPPSSIKEGSEENEADVMEAMAQSVLKELDQTENDKQPQVGSNEGRIAVGRSALKSLLRALAQHAAQQKPLQEIRETGKEVEMKEQEEKGSSWWFWSKTKPEAEVQTKTAESGVGPIGFLPYVPPSSFIKRWWRRFFYQRHDAQVMGEAAWTIVQGTAVPWSSVFPGEIRFKVGKKRTLTKKSEEEIKKDDQVESNDVTKQELEEEKPNEEDLVSAETEEWTLTEEDLSQVFFYYATNAEDAAGIEDQDDKI